MNEDHKRRTPIIDDASRAWDALLANVGGMAQDLAGSETSSTVKTR